MHELGKQVLLLIVVIVILGAVLALAGYFATTGTQPPANTAVELHPAPPSAKVLAQLAQSKGFQYLVSVTDTGFQPSKLTVKAGETVRFTNNSSQNVWVSAYAGGSKIYPGTSTCGASAFDSCGQLAHGDFWEFTFDSVGTWNFQNNDNKQQNGVITVVAK